MKSNYMTKFTIGVDVGGTNVKLGLVDSQGGIRARAGFKTQGYIRHKNQLIDRIVESVQRLIHENKISKQNVLGIGLGVPGLVNFQKGTVASLTNIHGWKNVPLRDIIQKKMGVSVFVDNDVNVICLGEWRYGAGRGCRNMICITLGTGVGGGLILNDALYRGEGFAAGEIGHIPINERGPRCKCGGMGCFEHYVGNQTLLTKAAKIFKNKDIQLPDVFRLASEGNTLAVQFWQETATHIGNALVGVINILNPRLIVFGGGVSNNLKFMNPTIRRVIKNQAMKVQRDMVKITRAQLGDDAGMIGAHVLVKEAVRGL
jgi:glucokinase